MVAGYKRPKKLISRITKWCLMNIQYTLVIHKNCPAHVAGSNLVRIDLNK